MNNKKRIAIVGAGISGLSSAYHLHKDFDLTVFEKEDYLGGHTDTHDLVIDEKKIRVDSGFIIFCPEYYPSFSSMLDELGVESQPTDMSFGAFNRQRNVLYNATSLNKLFCQRRNLLRPSFYRMLFDIVRFYNSAEKILESEESHTTVSEYLRRKKYSKSFSQDHLMPMISALWSATPERVGSFPIRHLVEFFKNHGLMKLVNRPQWLVVKNGSNSYVTALRKKLQVSWRVSSPVASIKRGQYVEIVTKDRRRQQFDAVIIATHADHALEILEDASPEEHDILGAIDFEANHVVVHSDESIMHPNKQSWASWNTEVPNDFDQHSQRVCTANYWMNSLQGLTLDTNVFTSLNSQHKIDPSKVYAERYYQHPVFTARSVAAQTRKSELDGKRNTYFVGAYWGWGFHEDGARSAKGVCDMIKLQFT